MEKELSGDSKLPNGVFHPQRLKNSLSRAPGGGEQEKWKVEVRAGLEMEMKKEVRLLGMTR